jgi:GT2 family glycosyltransferase
MMASVVVPTHRRPCLLDRCLAALAAQDFDPAQFEVIVADDARSSFTRQQVESWARWTAVTIRYVAPAAGRGPAAARNGGWRVARGAIVAFTDDDCIPDRRWLCQGMAAFEPGVAAVSGRVVVPIPERPTDYQRDAAGLETAEFVTANCFARRDVLAAVGGFDERYAAAWREDSDLQFTLLERGERIVRAPAATVVHPVRPAAWGISLRQQWKSQFNALLFKKFPVLYRRRIRAWPPWEYYVITTSMVSVPLVWLSGARPLAIVVLGTWAIFTSRFLLRRLHGNSRSPQHVAEMVVTSALIPPLSVFWRLYGALKFRVFFL